MVHPDEGTIHAWLDGALAPDEAISVEAHLQSCEHCSAAVAEARGFIAASSRILSALDDVPGQVIPAEMPAQPAVAHIRRADEQRKRRFRQTFAMAATLMLMLSGGLYVVNQTSRSTASFADTAALGERIADAARETPDSVAAPAVSSSQPAVTESQAGASTKAITPGARADVAATVASAPQPVPVPPPSAVAARSTGTTGGVAGNAAGTGAATQQLAQREVRAQDSARADQSQEQMRAGAARSANTSPVVASAPTAPAATPPLAPAVPIVALTGCYQLNAQGDLSIADSRRDEAMTVAALPSRMRLTDSLVSEAGGERRYLARSVMPGGTPMRRFAWSVASNGTLRLFVGDSANAPGVRVAADSGAAASTPARIRRIGCAN